MTIRDYLRVFRERWIAVVSAALVVVIGVGVGWSLRPPEYTAHLTMYISAQAGDTPYAAYQGSLLSQQRVSSYVKLVGSTRVSREVISELDLVGTPEAVAGHISASTAPDSVLIDVAVVGRAPTEVAAVANSVGRVFTGLVAELERPSAPGGVAAVAVRVVQPAGVPTAPSSMGLPVPLALGFLVGAAVGAGLAFARNAMDSSIKTADQLHEATQAPNLGAVAYDSKIPRRPLTVHEDPQSPRSEAFRQLRTNLQYVDVDDPRKVILVTSALPGEGKTTSVCNLAIAMAAAECRVLVVEADLRRPEITTLLGLDGSAGLTDILAGRMRPEPVIQSWADGRFDVLASGPLPPNPSELLASRQMGMLLSTLRGSYDVVLVDSPPLLPVTDAAALAPGTDGAILVCRCKRTTREQVRRAAAALAAVSVPLLGTVLTMVPKSDSQAYGRYDSYDNNSAGNKSAGNVEQPSSTAEMTNVLPADHPAAEVDRV